MKALIPLLIALNCGAAISDSDAVRAIVGEAAGESYKGKLAVAGALRNRGTLSGVYGLNAKHVSSQPEMVWADARRAWSESLTNDISLGATHWESSDFKTPYWARRMKVTARIGKHTFYK